MAEVFDFYERYELSKKPQFVNIPKDIDLALEPSILIPYPTDSKYDPVNQLQRTTNFSVYRTKGGRIFMSYFSALGHNDEDTGNWDMIICSDDDGKSFYNALAIEAPDNTRSRVFEGVFFMDPLNRLWFIYCQVYKRMDGRQGVWAIRCDEPDAEKLAFSAPRRLCDGTVPMNPIVLSDGRWAFLSYIHSPAAWHGDDVHDTSTYDLIWLPERVGISMYTSSDQGETWTCEHKSICFPYATFYECSLVEKKDCTLWILIRGMNCVGQSFSKDGGKNWSPAVVNGSLPLPNTHFAVQRLKSGRLLMIANYKADMFTYYVGRNHLTALLSDDDGETWSSTLLLDEREGVEQPGICEADDGNIYISYGYSPQFVGETLLAVVTEDDILAGKLVSPHSRLRISAGRATGMLHCPWTENMRKLAQRYHLEF